MREVSFYRCGFMGEDFPPNAMVNVDFSRAKLRDVEFRGLTLDRVRFPNDDEHIVIENYPQVLDKLIEALKHQGDRTARILVAGFEVSREWAPPNRRGVLNVQDFAQAGEGAVERIFVLLHQLGMRKMDS